MAIGSIGSNTVSTPATDTRTTSSKTREATARIEPVVADQVAAGEDRKPVRNSYARQGTLVDTYL